MRRSFTGGFSAPKPLQSVIRVDSGHSHSSRHMRRLLSGFAVLAALLFAVSTPSAAQQRIALVIGNAAYPKRTARDLACRRRTCRRGAHQHRIRDRRRRGRQPERHAQACSAIFSTGSRPPGRTPSRSSTTRAMRSRSRARTTSSRPMRGSRATAIFRSRRCGCSISCVRWPMRRRSPRSSSSMRHGRCRSRSRADSSRAA